MLKISYGGYLGLSPAILSQFTPKVCAAAKNCEKIIKTPIFEVPGRSKSSVLINLKTRRSA